MDPRREIALDVVEVTLLEDRAHVVRRGSVVLDGPTARLVVPGVSPVLADKTLLAELRVDAPGAGAGSTLSAAPPRGAPGARADSTLPADPPGGAPGARVTDARVVRRAVSRVLDEDVTDDDRHRRAAALERELRDLDAAVAEQEGEAARLRTEAGEHAKVVSLALREAAEDASWARAPAADWRPRLDEARASAADLRARAAGTALAVARRREERQRLAARLAALQGPAEREHADLELDVAGAAPGTVEIEASYVVPGACWRPYHTATLRGAEVVLATDACVWQNTGEPWNGVPIHFSTERPSLGASPPVLVDDVLSVQRRAEQIVVEMREQEVQTTGPGAAPGAPRLPGIDDGGVPLHLRALDPATIPSDGRPHRVPLSSFASPAEALLVATPELVDAALLRTTQVNRSGGPLLAGPVDLVRDAGFAGRTSIDFVAAGERFHLGWGPEPDLRIRREARVSAEDQRVLSAWARRLHDVEVRLSNLGVVPRQVQVTERIPVSEIEKVEVQLLRATGDLRPDADGFLSWSVAVPARGHASLELQYRLSRHESVTGT